MPQASQAVNDNPSSFPIKAVVRIGDRGGRGFIVSAADNEHFIVTAAHCLPRERYPSPHLANSINDLTFPDFIRPLAKSRRQAIWAELCVLSLADDIAVFRTPDSREPADAYGKFTTTALTIGRSPTVVPSYKRKEVPAMPAWVLSLDCLWLPCSVHNNGRFLAMRGAKIDSGAGSPILDADGAAIGLISTGDASSNLHPSLADCLPSWLLAKLSAERVAR
jgi:hypothetical protein